MRNNVCRYSIPAFLFVALFSGAGSCIAQGSNEVRSYFMAGAQGMDIGELNTRLKTNGYETFGKTFATFGFGSYGIKGRYLIGGEGNMVIGGNKSATIGADLFKTYLNGGYGLLRFGYIVARRGGLIVYPTLGIGGGGLGFGIERKETVSFDSILQNPRRNSILGVGFFLFDLGAGVDNLVIMNRREDEARGMAFGIRAGYLFAPYRSDWGDVLDGPDIGIQGAYVRLTIGVGRTHQ